MFSCTVSIAVFSARCSHHGHSKLSLTNLQNSFPTHTWQAQTQRFLRFPSNSSFLVDQLISIQHFILFQLFLQCTPVWEVSIAFYLLSSSAVLWRTHLRPTLECSCERHLWISRFPAPWRPQRGSVRDGASLYTFLFKMSFFETNHSWLPLILSLFKDMIYSWDFFGPLWPLQCVQLTAQSTHSTILEGFCPSFIDLPCPEMHKRMKCNVGTVTVFVVNRTVHSIILELKM